MLGALQPAREGERRDHPVPRHMEQLRGEGQAVGAQCEALLAEPVVVPDDVLGRRLQADGLAPVEFARAHAVPVGRVVGAGDGERLGVERHRRHELGVPRLGDEGKVELCVGHLGIGVFRERGEELKALGHAKLHDAAHRAGHHRQAERLVGADAQRLHAARLHHVLRLAPQARPAVRHVHHRLARVGELRRAAASPAVEELAAQLVLKGLDAPRERGLRHVQRAGRRAEGARLHHGEKRLYLLDVHVVSCLSGEDAARMVVQNIRLTYI